MTHRDDFLSWVENELYEAEVAIHNGDAGPRRTIWSRNEPVSILGAAANSFGLQEVDEIFGILEERFSGCQSYKFELKALDVVGDVAYTAGFEHISTSVDGSLRTFTLRATQIYRREDGEWKVAHRHADQVAD